MDVSPKTLREVEFREKMRGYHPEDVDQFLERVAAGIEVLQDRLRQAIERAQRAEQAATEAGGNDDALRRTLLLAQRTADLAVQEAREQAAGIVTAAEQQAQSLVGDADQRVRTVVTEAEGRSKAMLADSEGRAKAMLADAERRSQAMVSDAEARARRGHEDALIEVRTELAKLEATRQRLNSEVDSMTQWITEHRGQLRAALEDALTRVDQIDVTPPAPSSPSQGASQNAPAPAAPAPETSPPAAAAPRDTNWAPAPAPPSPPAATPTRRPQEDTVAWQPADHDAGADEAEGADPYFAQLRRAISDHDPLGPRPEGDSQGAAGGRVAPGGDT
jgi:DivIVA domain-containing protein